MYIQQPLTPLIITEQHHAPRSMTIGQCVTTCSLWRNITLACPGIANERIVETSGSSKWIHSLATSDDAMATCKEKCEASGTWWRKTPLDAYLNCLEPLQHECDSHLFQRECERPDQQIYAACCLLSVVGSLYVIFFCLKPGPLWNWKSGIIQKSIFIISCCDVVASTFNGATYNFLAMYVLPQNSTTVSGNLVFLTLAFASSAGSVVWSLIMSLSILRMLQLKPADQSHRKFYVSSGCTALAVAICVAVAPLAGMLAAALVGVVVVCCTVFLYVMVIKHVVQTNKAVSVEQRTGWSQIRPFVLFPATLFITLIPIQIRFIFTVSYEFNIVANCCYFTMGFWNCLVFMWRQQRQRLKVKSTTKKGSTQHVAPKSCQISPAAQPLPSSHP